MRCCTNIQIVCCKCTYIFRSFVYSYPVYDYQVGKVFAMLESHAILESHAGGRIGENAKPSTAGGDPIRRLPLMFHVSRTIVVLPCSNDKKAPGLRHQLQGCLSLKDFPVRDTWGRETRTTYLLRTMDTMLLPAYGTGAWARLPGLRTHQRTRPRPHR